MEKILAGNMFGNNWKEERKNNCLCWSRSWAQLHYTHAIPKNNFVQ